MGGISKADLTDADVYDASELSTDGTVGYLTVSITATTCGTKTVIISLAGDGEGILYSKDHPVAINDKVVITATSGGLGNGTFTVATVVSDTSFTVVETIGTSTGGSASFKYLPG